MHLPGQPQSEAHPVALVCHYLFKTAALLWYIFCTWISSSFVMNFVVAMVLVALDFWTVKNVTGRKLVALRWWNEANDTGSAWRFESAPEGTRVILPREKNLFWIGLIANVICWAVLAFFALMQLKFDYLVIPVMGCLLGSSNLVGYYRCSKEMRDQLGSYTTSFIQGSFQQAASHAVSSAVAPRS